MIPDDSKPDLNVAFTKPHLPSLSTVNTTEAERRLHWKIDLYIVPIVALLYALCTIDRVNGRGVIETNRPDDKNKQYQDVVRQGDQLITKLQKYGQAVRLRGSERA